MPRKSKEPITVRFKDSINVSVNESVDKKLPITNKYILTTDHICNINSRTIFGKQGDEIELNSFEAEILKEYIELV